MTKLSPLGIFNFEMFYTGLFRLLIRNILCCFITVNDGNP